MRSFSGEAGSERAQQPCWPEAGGGQPRLPLCHRGPDPGPGFPHVSKALGKAWRVRGSCVHFHKLVRKPSTSGLGQTGHLFH